EEVAKERDIQVASLGSLASEVSSLYGLKPDPVLVSAASSDSVQDVQVSSSLDRLYTLKTAALSGATTAGLTLGLTRNMTTADWSGRISRRIIGPEKARSPPPSADAINRLNVKVPSLRELVIGRRSAQKSLRPETQL